MRPRPVLYRIYFSFAGGMSHTCVSVRPRPISHTVFYVHMYTERRGCISGACLCFCETQAHISYSIFVSTCTLRDEVVYI